MSNNGVNTKLLKAKMVMAGYNSQKDFAKDIGKSEHTIANLLNGASKPSYELINLIYQKLNLTPEEGTAIFFADNLRDTKVHYSEVR